jgi:hypothetical protein
VENSAEMGVCGGITTARDGRILVTMARSTSTETTPAKTPKEPGRIKQMWQVFQMTRRYDSMAVWWMAAALIVPILLGVAAAFLLNNDNIISFILYVVVGVLLGVVLLLVVLGRRAEKAAYSQIEGEPGAVGAVFKSGLRRTWRAAEMPVAVNGRSKAAVYRAVGKPGVVLVTEGTKAGTQKMVDEERRKVARITPGVTVSVLHVGGDEPDAIPLHKLGRKMNRIKVKDGIGRNEINAVSNRLQSLGQNGLPIPKGVDPMRVRSGRPR